MRIHWKKPAPVALIVAMVHVIAGCGSESADSSRAANLRRVAVESSADVVETQSAERGLACQPCAPGDVTLADSNGDFGGWCAHVSEPANIQVNVLDVDLPAGKAVVSLDLDYTRPPSSLTGLFRPLLIDFIQVCDDAQTVTMIEIAEEDASNQTGAEWNTFDWYLFPFGSAAVATFDVSASGAYEVAPFASSTFSDFADAPTNQHALRLKATGGIVPAGGSFAPGAGATPTDGGILKINISLSTTGPVSWVLKQIPGHVTLLADVDGDGDVDGSDLAIVAGCLMGPGIPPSGACLPADLDRDGDVDLVDISQFNSLAGQ